MSTKTASIVSSIITGILVLLAALVSAFGGIIALNGFMFSPTAAIVSGFTCMGVTLILSPILAWILTKTFISRYNWKGGLAILVSVLATSLFGSVMSFASIFVMIIIAETIY